MRGRDLLNTPNEASPVAVKKKGKGVVAVTDERQKLLANGSAQDHSESLFRVVLHTNDDFISLLQNQYIVTPVSDYLHTLIHLLNLHPNRKHFIFFDSIPVLLYVRAIMEHLVRKGGDGTGTSLSDPNKKKRQKQCVSAADSGVVSFGSASGSSGLERKAVLYVSKIFSMHEDMNENTKFNEYNGFLEHQCGSSGGRLSAAGASSLTSKIFAHKRDRLVRSQEKAAGNNTSHQRLSDSSISMAELKNARYTGGLKRDAFSSTGTGAVLLCTDEAAFGLDVRDVDYVYHAEVPRTVRSYIHRIGRVGRMGMRGSSIMILAGDGANETEKLDVDDRLTTTSNDVPLCDTALPHHHLPVSAAEEENTYNKAGSYRTLANSHTGRKLLTAMSAGSLASRRGRSALQRINDDLNDPMKAATTQEEAEIELRMMLTKEQKDFVEKLKAAKSLERYKLPHVALLTPTLRAVVAGDPNVVKLGRKAAMALAHFGENKQNPVSESAVKKLRSDKSQRNENDAVSINSEGKYEDDNEGDGFSWFSPKASLDALLLSQYKS